MRPETGLLLRLIGPLIEIVCALLFVRYRGQGRTVAGGAKRAESEGIGTGQCLVGVGRLAERPAASGNCRARPGMHVS